MARTLALALSAFAAATLMWLPPGPAASARAAGIEWIDVHSHPIGGKRLADYQGAVDAALAIMAESSLRHIVLMPPPQVQQGAFDQADFAHILKPHPSRLSFLGGGGTLNVMLQRAAGTELVPESVTQRFEEEAAAILAAGARGFGEISAHHLSILPGHPYESVAADHPLLRQLASIAARHDVVIDLHFDPVSEELTAPDWMSSPPNPRVFRPNVEAFERLLAHERKAKIVWAHAGSDLLGHWNVALSRRLLEAHPNLHMSVRMAPGRVPAHHPLTPAGALKPEWLALLTDFADRFVIGADQFFLGSGVMGGPAATFAQRSAANRQRTQQLLAQLPEPARSLIARENAKRLYRLPD